LVRLRFMLANIAEISVQDGIAVGV
jgi:hypothetical protein